MLYKLSRCLKGGPAQVMHAVWLSALALASSQQLQSLMTLCPIQTLTQLALAPHAMLGLHLQDRSGVTCQSSK